MGFPQFGGNWPALRLQQARALPAPGSVVDTSGMAVITDLGDTIAPPHPKNKTEVGRRLALYTSLLGRRRMRRRRRTAMPRHMQWANSYFAGPARPWLQCESGWRSGYRKPTRTFADRAKPWRPYE